jgi:acetate kinase
LRRYGFHGLSYTHVVAELRRIGGDALADGRVIIAHLGSGASLAAVKKGRSVETTMGFTPTGGLPMSTRSGDLDPGVFLWLGRHGARSIEELFALTTLQSGLLALSETTSDLRELVERENSDRRAAETVDYFCYHVRKAIGSLAAVLGGLDTLVFTGGVGEHQPVIRQRVCADLSFLGIELDSARNAADAPVISRDHTAVGVRIISADEERMIAQAAREVLQTRAVVA